ncbi:helix-turn-helix domain-containing protein [Terrilactibacillus sp. BCM23-1]|uniref:Helix-turn-helix domain-containing protein n=1 Tax=Terrilactibacillus tamarindi TaxID=2599694 RepID=A0A6N8CV33_9BACI|nr:AraC family transcriptional regulator [Terrilactibacillus tamarindi]MTT33025.1 helix-turn-helix domain-containing protein [Terrilactibacillus tamarindi]
MGLYLEIPVLNKQFPFRSFINQGHQLVSPHWHKEVEIIYVIKGSINIGVNDESIHIQKGEILFINGGDIHYILASSDSERLVIQFDLTFFQEVSTMNVIEKNLRDAFTQMKNSSTEWNKTTKDKMVKIIEDIHEENTQKQEGYPFVIKAKLYEMMALIFREIPEKEPEDTSDSQPTKTQETLEKLDQIFSYVENHYKEGITLQDIAKYSGFSTYYFTKFFKKNTGTTFIKFLNEYRLNKAKWILLNENYTVTEIAEMAGFTSVKTFHHLFKEVMGVSPLKYRKTISGNN